MTVQIFKKVAFEEGEEIHYYKHLERDSMTLLRLVVVTNTLPSPTHFERI